MTKKMKARTYYDIYDFREVYFKNKPDLFQLFREVVNGPEVSNGSLECLFAENSLEATETEQGSEITEELRDILRKIHKDLGEEIKIYYWW